MPLILRYLGMAVSWAGFTMSFALLFLSMQLLSDVGGFCAEGGPYVIETHCPGNTEWFAPLSVYLGLASVAVALFFAKGLGASLTIWAWPILFIGLGSVFLRETFSSGGGVEPIGLVLGIMFFVMGATPLAFWLRHPINRRALLVGTARIDGTSTGSINLNFDRVTGNRPMDGDRMRAIDYLVLVPLWLAEAAFGVWLAVLWFYA